MTTIRSARAEDLFGMQACNAQALPENYQMKYYILHALSWPQLMKVAEDTAGKISGYVLGKMDDEEVHHERHGHITSVAVARSHRKLGLAQHLMRCTHHCMQESFAAEHCTLHVRVTNVPAFAMYQNSLGYSAKDVEAGYYGDRESAFLMQCMFPLGIQKRKEREEARERKRLGLSTPPEQQQIPTIAKRNINSRSRR